LPCNANLPFPPAPFYFPSSFSPLDGNWNPFNRHVGWSPLIKLGVFTLFHIN
jgi:hypothetical protein